MTKQSQHNKKKKKNGDPCWHGYTMFGMKTKGGREVPNCVKDKSNKKKQHYRKTKDGAGMTRAGVRAYRRANPGSKLQTAVTAKKVKKGSKDEKRRKSYCARSLGQLKKSSLKTQKDPNSRINQARKRWRCTNS